MSDTRSENHNRSPVPEDYSSLPKLPPAAKRALAEAKARREQNGETPPPAEKGGPEGLEPTRYGDWEKGGLASDF